MTPTEHGRHCASCQKVVVDFTHMTDAEVRRYFKQHAGQDTCGRLRSGQLGRDLAPVQRPHWKRALPLAAALGAAVTSYGQTQPPVPVSTSIQVEKGESVASGMLRSGDIVLSIATVTHERLGVTCLADSTGRFDLRIPESEWKAEDLLLLAAPGYERKQVAIGVFEQACPLIQLMPLGADTSVETCAQPADSTVILRGCVRDELGEPFPFATVILGDGRSGAVTDFEGFFSFEVPVGWVKLSPFLQVHAVGYEEAVILLSSHFPGQPSDDGCVTECLEVECVLEPDQRQHVETGVIVMGKCNPNVVMGDVDVQKVTPRDRLRRLWNRLR